MLCCPPAGMRYVVDAGRSKQKILEQGGSLAQYDVRWISKASAQQRAGRSGRTGPGHCYRSAIHCLPPTTAWHSCFCCTALFDVPVGDTQSVQQKVCCLTLIAASSVAVFLHEHSPLHLQMLSVSSAVQDTRDHAGIPRISVYSAMKV